MPSSTNEAVATTPGEGAPETIEAIKGFTADFRANGRTFEIGQTYTIDGELTEFDDGFDAVPADEHPLTVFNRVPPAGARYAVVEQGGKIIREYGFTASPSITVKSESPTPRLVERVFKWVFDRTTPANRNHTDEDRSASSATGYQSASSATGYRSASSATGYQSASSATGYQSASSATGYRSASSATGYRSASSATGDRSASSATGYQSAALATGYGASASVDSENGVAIATGEGGRARGEKPGSVLFLIERDDEGGIAHHWSGKVGENGIEPGVFYTLRDGKPVKVGAEGADD